RQWRGGDRLFRDAVGRGGLLDGLDLLHQLASSRQGGVERGGPRAAPLPRLTLGRTPPHRIHGRLKGRTNRVYLRTGPSGFGGAPRLDQAARSALNPIAENQLAPE